MLTTSYSLLERLRHPEQEAAWVRFVSVYSPMLFALGRKLGVPAADLEDFVQDVLTRTVQAMPGFHHDGRHRFRAWLKTVALNHWRNRRKSQTAVPLDSAHDPGMPNEVQRFIEEEYVSHLVRRALQVMRTDFEPATWQACWETTAVGRPAAVVAAQLGLTTTAVYIARSRVLRRLREELADFLD